MKKYLFSNMILLIASCSVAAQSKDSKGKNTFSYFAFNKAQFAASPKDFSANVTVLPDTIIKFTSFINKQRNVERSGGVQLEVAVTNIPMSVNSKDFEKLYPGFRFKLGYQLNANKIDSDYTGWTYSAGLYGVYSWDNMLLFDPAEMSASKQYPKTYGIEGNLTLFPGTLRHYMLIHTNISLTRSFNDDELLNYKEIDQSTQQPSSSVVAFSDFDGKYGTLREHIEKLRISFSLPLFIGTKERQKKQAIDSADTQQYQDVQGEKGNEASTKFPWYNKFYFVPYTVVNTNEYIKPKYLTGFTINITSKPLFANRFVSPSSIGLGADWENKNDEWSKVNIFIRGSITF